MTSNVIVTPLKGMPALAMALVALAAACGNGDSGVTVEPTGGDQRYEGSFTVLEAAEHGPELCYDVEGSLPPQCGGLPIDGWDWDAVDDEESVGGTTWGGWHVTGTFDGRRFRLTEPPQPARTDDKPDSDRDFSPACANPDVVDPSQGVAEWEAATQEPGFELSDLVAVWVSDPAGDWDGPFVGNVVVSPGGGQAALDRIRQHYGGPVCVVERDAPTAAELVAVQEEVSDDEARSALGPIQGAGTDERRSLVHVTVWLADQAAVAYAEQRWGELVELRSLLQPVE